MLNVDSPRLHMSFVSSSSWREMIGLPLVSILLLAECLAKVTAVTVTPVDGTHISLDYQNSVNYNEVNYITIDIDVSILKKISHNVC